MYFHSQNIKKEDRENCFIHWRCWFRFGKKDQNEFTFYINSPSKFWHIDIDLCENGWGEEAIGFSIACPLFYIAIGFHNPTLYKLLEKITKRRNQKYTQGRSIGISFHSSALWVKLWEDQLEWRHDDPKWWKFTIHFDDLLMGKSKCTRELISSGITKINMPEGNYGARYKVEKFIYSRSRWPFKRVREYIDFDIPVGIPHEGKGENSWDCGMDATFGIGVEWRGNVHEAVKEVAMRCLSSRQKYGALSSPAYGEWRAERLRNIKIENGKDNELDNS